MNLINGVIVGSFITAASTVFVGWQAYEARKNNQLMLRHNERIESQHLKENSVKAITRFDDKISDKINDLLQVKLANITNQDFVEAIRVILYINKWSVYVDARISNNHLIKRKLYFTLRNFCVKYQPIANHIESRKAFRLKDYCRLLDYFDIIK